MKVKLSERDRTYVRVINPLQNVENYEVLANFPFTSEAKKMSILVRNSSDGRYIYYVKGAEIALEHKVKPS